jgi:Txe/YoeB family toxin of Txe-Axe toxin-antitoxin module
MSGGSSAARTEPVEPDHADAENARRITEEHRLVYLLDGDDIVIRQARYHH